LAAALSSVVIPSEDSRSQIFRFATLRLTDLPVAQSLFTNISRPLSNAFSRMLTGAAPDFTRALAAAPETLEKRLPAGRYNLQTPSKIILPSTLRLCAFMTLHGWFGEQRTNIVRLAQDPQGCRALKIVVTEAASYIEALDQALRNHERSRVFKAATERQVALTLIASYNELPGSSQDAALALRTLKIKESLSRNLSTNLERL
jgi:hypothetical protein